LTRARAGLIVGVFAAFLLLGAQGAFGLPAASEQSATGTTGVQDAAGTCPEPRLTGLPPRPKFTNATIHLTLVGMTQGAWYLVKAGRAEILSGSAEGPTVKNSFLLPDQGVKSRKIPIEVIISQDDCDNSPWKLTKKIRYKAVVAPTTTSPQNNSTPTPTPTPTPVTPAKPTPAPAKIKLPKPVSSFPKLPQGPSLTVRTWISPLDGGTRLLRPPAGPHLSRTERKADKAKSSFALVGLAGLFVLVAGITFVGLWVLKRRDDVSLAEALGALPQHLDEGDPDMIRSEEEPATIGLAAHAMAGAPPIAAQVPLVEPPTQPTKPEQPVEEPTTLEPPTEEPTVAQEPAEEPAIVEPAPSEELEPAGVGEGENGAAATVAGTGNGAAAAVGEGENGAIAPTFHREQVEAELQRMLSEVGVSAELEGILADAKAEAERQGISIDSDLMLQALCDELNGAGTISEPARTELRSKFKEIIADEAERVPN
jgi:hypothetical protein